MKKFECQSGDGAQLEVGTPSARTDAHIKGGSEGDSVPDFYIQLSYDQVQELIAELQKVERPETKPWWESFEEGFYFYKGDLALVFEDHQGSKRFKMMGVEMAMLLRLTDVGNWSERHVLVNAGDESLNVY